MKSTATVKINSIGRSDRWPGQRGRRGNEHKKVTDRSSIPARPPRPPEILHPHRPRIAAESRGPRTKSPNLRFVYEEFVCF